MRTIVPLATLVVAAAFVAPAATASWMSYGSFEPDTPQDVPAFMWQEPPGVEKDRIYFNVYTTTTTADANPNLGALRSRHEVVGTESHTAVLGIWIDCNGDGYIGMLETGVREYKSELLLDKTLCPDRTGTANGWTPGAHNYRGWVTELIPIGNKYAAGRGDTKLYVDPDAMVWGDYGLPGAGVAEGTTSTCAISPRPRGTMQSTGGMLEWAECFDGHLVAERYNALLETVDPEDSNGLQLADDQEWNEPGHPLNVKTFGDDGSEHAAVNAQDCSADHVVSLGTLTTGTPLYNLVKDYEDVGVRPVPANPVNGDFTSWTVPGQWNATSEQGIEDDCDHSNDRGADFYGGVLGEGDFNGVSSAYKTEAHWNFNFSVATRGSAPLGLVTPGKSGAPTDLGVHALSRVCTSSSCIQSSWNTGSVLTKETPRTVRVSLGDVSAGVLPSVEPDSGYVLTFYAYVGNSITASGPLGRLPGGGATGIYADEACNGATSGVKNGWECDGTKWYVNPDGSLMPEPIPYARPGSPYNLRDVDCYDGTAYHDGAVSVGAGVPYYGTQSCH